MKPGRFRGSACGLGAHVLTLAEAAERARFRAGPDNWLARLTLASGTVSSVLARGLERDVALTARISVSLLGWWRRSGRLAEGRQWYEAIRRVAVLEPGLRARVECSEALVNIDIADYDAIEQLSAAALAVLADSADHLWAARALTAASTAAKYHGAGDLARRQLQAAIEHLTESGDRQELAVGYNNLGALAAEQHKLDVAEEAYRRSLEIKEELGDERSIALTQANLGDVYTQLGRTAEARAILAEGLATAFSPGVDDAFLAAFIKINIGENELFAGYLREAADAFREAREIADVMEIPRFQALAAAGLGRALFQAGDKSRGLRFLHEGRGLARAKEDRLLLQDIDEKASAAGMTEPRATAQVGRSDKGGKPSVLTPREREILMQVATGGTTREIARRLGLSENTVERHINNIFKKLGAHNRIEALRIAAAAGLIPGSPIPGPRPAAEASEVPDDH